MNNEKKLSLYQSFACPFCMRVQQAMSQLNIDVEIRDIWRNPEYRKELITGGGNPQVPCLRIEDESGDEWMYESADIIQYLQNHHAKRCLA